ncbi:MAG: hypothetical protein GY857_16085, partial [Desulfobacula sp.]|nr:hypothetical protein [Desulfobacula sp.]
MTKIQIEKNPLMVKLSLSRNAPVKIIKVEPNELLIALKNVTLSKDFKITGKEKSKIKSIGMDSLQGNVLAVILTSFKPYEYIQSGYKQKGSTFIINLEKKPGGGKQVKKQVSKPDPLPAAKKINNKEIVKESETTKETKQEKIPQKEPAVKIEKKALPSPKIEPVPGKTKQENQPDKKTTTKVIEKITKIASPSV